jgi:hypothetical protein
MSQPRANITDLDAHLQERIDALIEEGRAVRERFVAEVCHNEWHSFIPADYGRVLATLLELREGGLKFLEWGSATGVIAIMADLLGFESYGIEVDPVLVDLARDLATRHGSNARFAAGSYLPADYEWISPDGDRRLGAVGSGPPGYDGFGIPLEDFDLVYGYPWSGEEPIMLDVFRRRGGKHARLLLNGGNRGIEVLRNWTTLG